MDYRTIGMVMALLTMALGVIQQIVFVTTDDLHTGVSAVIVLQFSIILLILHSEDDNDE